MLFSGRIKGQFVSYYAIKIHRQKWTVKGQQLDKRT